MAAASPSPRRATLASTAIGVLLGGAAAAFVVRSIVRDRARVGDALADAQPAWLALGLVLAAAAMVAIAAWWRHALRLLGEDVPMHQVVARYFVGEVGKYLPGGVWTVVGRAELLRRYGIRRAAAYGSVALSLLALYLSALLVVAAGLPVLVSGGDGTGPVAVLLALPLGLVALHPRVLRPSLDAAGRLARRPLDLPIPAWRASVGLVLGYLPAWVLVGGATWAVARALDPSAPLAEVAVAAVLSWVVGFLLVPVPSGAGVREAAFVAAAGSLDPGIAAATAVAARVLFVLVDGLGAAIGAARLRSGRARSAR